MNIDANVRVRELVLGIPGAERVFDKHRIDYCCGGERSLGDACTAGGLECASVVAELARMDVERGASKHADWRARPLSELVAHVVTEHHAYTRVELARLRRPLEKVLEAHGAAHPELTTVKRLFDELERDLVPHMMKEEKVLFPIIERLGGEARGGPTLAAPFGSVENPVRMMRFEHQRDGALLESLRAVTDDYQLPRGVCTTYALLYEGLRALDADLRRHIHLENNVLFPRALEAERAAGG
jgi:regulator of cell morphogenesis and NO signaling